MKKIHIISGGTVSHIRPHLALCAPAYGSAGMKIANILRDRWKNLGHSTSADHLNLHQTRMATGYPNRKLETNEDVSKLLDKLIADPDTGVIFMPVALCDFEVFHIDDGPKYDGGLNIGKEYSRLKTSDGQRTLMLKPAEKLIGKIRKERKDIFLVGFKTTTGATENQMFDAGMNLLKRNSCNLVLVNDIQKRLNMILTPEMARYCVTEDRDEALRELVGMTTARSGLTFHRTNLVGGRLLGWHGPKVPHSLREVVNHCIKHKAYKAFNGVTVGHFGFLQKVEGQKILYSSRRKKNYNFQEDRDLVGVVFNDGIPTAHGAKPSAGVRSQYELFKYNPDYDCVIHFHCPLKDGSKIRIRPQKHLECGSLECGMNTLDGMTEYCDGVAAVMLDKHGPNILFKRDIDPEVVIDFIENNFDLSRSTSE